MYGWIDKFLNYWIVGVGGDIILVFFVFVYLNVVFYFLGFVLVVEIKIVKRV